MIGKRKAVRIPSELWTTIRENLEALGASSVEEYVEAVLREDLREKGLLPAYTPEEAMMALPAADLIFLLL